MEILKVIRKYEEVVFFSNITMQCGFQCIDTLKKSKCRERFPSRIAKTMERNDESSLTLTPKLDVKLDVPQKKMVLTGARGSKRVDPFVPYINFVYLSSFLFVSVGLFSFC